MTGTPRIVVLAGGVGGSRFVLGVRGALHARGIDDTAGALTVVVNTGETEVVVVDERTEVLFSTPAGVVADGGTITVPPHAGALLR